MPFLEKYGHISLTNFSPAASGLEIFIISFPSALTGIMQVSSAIHDTLKYGLFGQASSCLPR